MHRVGAAPEDAVAPRRAASTRATSSSSKGCGPTSPWRRSGARRLHRAAARASSKTCAASSPPQGIEPPIVHAANSGGAARPSGGALRPRALRHRAVRHRARGRACPKADGAATRDVAEGAGVVREARRRGRADLVRAAPRVRDAVGDRHRADRLLRRRAATARPRRRRGARRWPAASDRRRGDDGPADGRLRRRRLGARRRRGRAVRRAGRRARSRPGTGPSASTRSRTRSCAASRSTASRGGTSGDADADRSPRGARRALDRRRRRGPAARSCCSPRARSRRARCAAARPRRASSTCSTRAAPCNRIDAVLLTGGSAFGLGAADGVMRFCEERGMGFPTAGGPVPIVVALGAVRPRRRRRLGPARARRGLRRVRGRDRADGRRRASVRSVPAPARRSPSGRAATTPGPGGSAARSSSTATWSSPRCVAVNAFGDVLDVRRHRAAGAAAADRHRRGVVRQHDDRRDRDQRRPHQARLPARRARAATTA